MTTGLYGQNYVSGPYTMEAQEAISRGYAVKLKAGADKQVELCDSQGEAAYGIAIETKAAGQGIAILPCTFGNRFDKAVADEALATLYTKLTVAANGKFEPALTGDRVVGINLSTASGSDDTFEIELRDGGEVI